VTVHHVLAAPQLAAPEPVEAAYRQVVGALVAMLRCLNGQVDALEEQLAVRFAAHPDAVIVLAAQLRRDAAPSSGKVRHPATAPPSSAATRTHWRLTRYRQVRRRP
jgi:hypothetical protein